MTAGTRLRVRGRACDRNFFRKATEITGDLSSEVGGALKVSSDSTRPDDAEK